MYWPLEQWEVHNAEHVKFTFVVRKVSKEPIGKRTSKLNAAKLRNDVKHARYPIRPMDENFDLGNDKSLTIDERWGLLMSVSAMPQRRS